MVSLGTMKRWTGRVNAVVFGAAIAIAVTACEKRPLPAGGALSVAEPPLSPAPDGLASTPAPSAPMPPAPATEPAEGSVAFPPSPPGPRLSEPQIAEVLQLIVEGDIHVALGIVSLGYGADPRVHSFAAAVISAHRPEDQTVQALSARIGRVDSDAQADLYSEIESAVTDLTADKQSPCLADQRYMEFQVRFDTKALAIVTSRLLPSAVDAELRDAVSRELPVLAAELDDANAIHDAIELQADDCKAGADAGQ